MASHLWEDDDKGGPYKLIVHDIFAGCERGEMEGRGVWVHERLQSHEEEILRCWDLCRVNSCDWFSAGNSKESLGFKRNRNSDP